jgi:hypothetical protein
MPLPRTGSISASQINTELTLQYGTSSTSTLSLNGSPARGLAQKSSGAISFDDFHGTFQIYDGQDSSSALSGYAAEAAYGFEDFGDISSTSVSGYVIDRLCYNLLLDRTELFITSGSSLGKSFFTTLKVGTYSFSSSSSTYGYSTNFAGFSYWVWSGDPAGLASKIYTYVSCRIL